MDQPFSTMERTSHLVFIGVLVAVGWLRLGPLLITVLFAYFALSYLTPRGRRWLGLLLFLLLVLVLFYGFASFLEQAVVLLPGIVAESLPRLANYARSYGIELPFQDIASLKGVAVDELSHQLGYLANFAKFATKEFLFVLIGIVIACAIYIDGRIDLDAGNYALGNNAYAILAEHISRRFRALYTSFATVMGAQLIISFINTVFTAIFVFTIGLPYAALVTAITFLAGLLPIVGNLISNTIIVFIGATVSPQLAISALLFLIVLHKAEYFLNSKIIGGRIKNPMWLTLLGLLLGERLMGIPGMVLAPVVLHYVKAELSRVEVPA